MKGLPSIPEMERAVDARDASYDGIFFVAVRTTGIFCRPSCKSRKPLARNREYFATAREALFAGYRPCKRCRPLDAAGRPPEWVERLLAAVDRAPQERITDADLRRMAIDPARARRFFRKHYGMTFHTYCRGRRMGEALQQIRRGADLDDVTLGHGYESYSGFREAFVQTFGRPPGRSRDADCILTTFVESPLGPLLAGATAAGICLLEFSPLPLGGEGLGCGEWIALRRRTQPLSPEGRGKLVLTTLRQCFGCAIVPGTNDHLENLKEQLDRYFARTLRQFDLPLLYPGSPFQRRVWEELLRIPYGETRSYEALAHAIGANGAQRAVGRANGQNRIAIVIPCHRVVNKGGKLGGYGGGLWRKQFLLDLERGPSNGSAGPLFEADA